MFALRHLSICWGPFAGIAWGLWEKCGTGQNSPLQSEKEGSNVLMIGPLCWMRCGTDPAAPTLFQNNVHLAEPLRLSTRNVACTSVRNRVDHCSGLCYANLNWKSFPLFPRYKLLNILLCWCQSHYDTHTLYSFGHQSTYTLVCSHLTQLMGN